MSGTDAFTPTIYDTIRDGARRSAGLVVPLILHRFQGVRTVIDVGCGEGHWAAEFERHGCRVSGIDGPHVSHILGDNFTSADLTEPLPDLPEADLVICLEVGEHLPESRAGGLVDDLRRLGRQIVFSAAIPHQTGPGHVTCRWPSWWDGHFERHGLRLDGSLRWPIWEDTRIEPWYRQNLCYTVPAHQPIIGPLDVVHPEIHGWGR